MRVEGDIDRTSSGAHMEDKFPVLATVGRAVQAALRIVLGRVAQSCHIDRVGIRGVHHDLADMAGLDQTHVLPCAAGIGRLVHAVTVGDVDTNGRFAHTGIDDVAI